MAESACGAGSLRRRIHKRSCRAVVGRHPKTPASWPPAFVRVSRVIRFRSGLCV